MVMAACALAPQDSYGGRILWTPDAAAVAPSDGVSSPARQRPAGPNEAQQPAVAQSGPRAQEGSPAKGQAQAAQAHAGAAAAAARGAAGAPQQAQSSVPSPITREPGAGNAQERQPAQTDRRSLPFDGTDLLPGTPQLHPGDEVEFLLVHDRQTNEPKATQVQHCLLTREGAGGPVYASGHTCHALAVAIQHSGVFLELTNQIKRKHLKLAGAKCVQPRWSTDVSSGISWNQPRV